MGKAHLAVRRYRRTVPVLPGEPVRRRRFTATCRAGPGQRGFRCLAGRTRMPPIPLGQAERAGGEPAREPAALALEPRKPDLRPPAGAVRPVRPVRQRGRQVRQTGRVRLLAVLAPPRRHHALGPVPVRAQTESRPVQRRCEFAGGQPRGPLWPRPAQTPVEREPPPPQCDRRSASCPGPGSSANRYAWHRAHPALTRPPALPSPPRPPACGLNGVHTGGHTTTSPPRPCPPPGPLSPRPGPARPSRRPVAAGAACRCATPKRASRWSGGSAAICGTAPRNPEAMKTPRTRWSLGVAPPRPRLRRTEGGGVRRGLEVPRMSAPGFADERSGCGWSGAITESKFFPFRKPQVSAHAGYNKANPCPTGVSSIGR
jgi:hypothetical protein